MNDYRLEYFNGEKWEFVSNWETPDLAWVSLGGDTLNYRVVEDITGTVHFINTLDSPESQVEQFARMFANTCEFKSNHPYDWQSVYEGYLEGFKTADRLLSIKLEEIKADLKGERLLFTEHRPTKDGTYLTNRGELTFSVEVNHFLDDDGFPIYSDDKIKWWVEEPSADLLDVENKIGWIKKRVELSELQEEYIRFIFRQSEKNQ